MESSVKWLTPPYFTFYAGDDDAAPESCLVYLKTGRKMLVDLVRFSPDEPTIVFRSKEGEIDVTMGLDHVKTIRLARPLMLRRDYAPLEARAEEVFAPSDRQAFSVEFHDNEIMSGETIGYANAANGLYLFLPVENDRIVRCFIPRQAMSDYRIGLPIGELLVEEHLASKDAVEAALARQRELRTQRIGDYLSENRVVSREQLQQAIRHQEQRPVLKLGEALRSLKLLSEEQLNRALAKQRENRKLPLGRILIEMGVIDERALKGALAKKLGIPFVSLSKFNFDPNALKRVNAAFARKHVVMPLCMHQDALVVAFENPLSTMASEELRFLAQTKIVPAIAAHDEITAAIREHYGAYGTARLGDEAEEQPQSKDEYQFHRGASKEVQIDEIASRLFAEDKGGAAEPAEKPVSESDSVLVQLVNKMILDAHRDRVSDIHVETYPGKRNTLVRFRKDGALVPYLEIPANFRNAVVSRIKIMSQLDIAEKRKPQDGKIEFKQFGPSEIELRVATIPTANGLEDVVMRVLAGAKPVPMDELALAPVPLATLQRLMARPYGLLLVCGPTGSGKTTTLHSLLGYINTPDRKVWTAEDPVEITQAGLRQVQVNAKIGWTFAAAMRSFLRADPDVIMVGEMRDQETTKIGIEASLTGHLVLSTLHTNSAAESVVRLLDLGMDPFNFADALLGILAQRLAKALCGQCKERYRLEPGQVEELAAEFCDGTALDPAATVQQWRGDAQIAGGEGFTAYRAVGCEHCGHSGYRGRLGLHELLTVAPPIRRLIQNRAPAADLLSAALEGGMHTLKQDGIVKVLRGLTDMTQVRAVSA